MGMFDYVRVEYALPVPEHRKLTGWQTKSFECLLWTYVIDSRGNLWVEKFDLEAVPEEERPYRDDPDSLIRAIAGTMRRVNERTEEVDFTGTMVFYTHDAENNWVEYAATFTNGSLLTIRQHPTVGWSFFAGSI
jgi:hypothetical protein